MNIDQHEPFIDIDKSSSVPVYRQIESQIRAKIDAGILKPRDRLPTERDLSVGLSISRGTIKKAYEGLLLTGVLVSVQGSGTYVSDDPDCAKQKKKPFNRLYSMAGELLDSGCRPDEIRTLLNIALAERQTHRINIAAVDCNPEVLSITETQLANLGDINLAVFLLDDVKSYSQPEDIFEAFDIIFTTTTHYNDLMPRLPNMRDKIVKAAISPDQDTIVSLAGIKDLSRLGIVTRSWRYGHIIGNILEDMGMTPEADNYFLLGAGGICADFLKDKDTLIMPPFYALGSEVKHIRLFTDFLRAGGNIINFNYRIEKGSLLHIEERIEHASRKELV